MRSTCSMLAAAAAVAMLSASAAAAPAKVAPSVQAVIDCRQVADEAQRLACYDKAADVLEKAEATGDLVSLDREQRRVARKQAFGFSLPSLAILDSGEKPEDVDRIQETLASARQDAEGKWTFVMQDGAVWRQIDDAYLSRDPHHGSAIVIRRAMLGSYILNVDGQPALRVHRDN